MENMKCLKQLSLKKMKGNKINREILTIPVARIRRRKIILAILKIFSKMQVLNFLNYNNLKTAFIISYVIILLKSNLKSSLQD